MPAGGGAAVTAMQQVVPPLRRDVAEAAAGWLLRLDDASAGDADRADWQCWLQADPEHRRAWQQLESLGLRLRAMPPAVAMATLDLPASRQRRRLLLALLTLGAGSGLAYRQLPWRRWSADQRTAIGERRSLQLPDGSQLQLNTASAIDVRFDAALRRVRLIEGEVWIQTQADPAGRPFVVDTGDGSVRALGTRFTVRQLDDGVLATVHEHAVEIHIDGLPVQRVDAGQSRRFSHAGVEAPTPADPNAQAWTRGLLYADRMPLDAVVAELSRYRRGILRCDPAIAGLRVSGALPLDRSDDTLALLARMLPIRVQARYDWWVTLLPRTDG